MIIKIPRKDQTIFFLVKMKHPVSTTRRKAMKQKNEAGQEKEPFQWLLFQLVSLHHQTTQLYFSIPKPATSLPFHHFRVQESILPTIMIQTNGSNSQHIHIESPPEEASTTKKKKTKTKKSAASTKPFRFSTKGITTNATTFQKPYGSSPRIPLALYFTAFCNAQSAFIISSTKYV